MNREEYDALGQLITYPGWQIYLNLLKVEYDRKLLSLRKMKRDNTFDKANGFMDGLDCAKNLIEEEMSEFSHNFGGNESHSGKEET